MIAKSHRWHLTAVASAACALLAWSPPDALALSLGRISVQSALGEPLRAEIDIAEITAEEAASLRASIAPAPAYAAAGMDYSPALTGLRVAVQRRADGRTVVRLQGDKAINEPYLDLILEANWATGRILRDYTLLFDPPAASRSAPQPTLAQTPATPPAPAVAPPKAAAVPAPAAPATPPPEARPAAVLPKPAPAVPAASPPAQVAAAGDDASRKTIVRPGDTAGKLAMQLKAPSVSLDQMLVAMLRTSPETFIDGNINRIRSGAVLKVPSSEQALSVTPPEASRILAAHSKDFDSFRRNLAANAPQTGSAVPERSSAGSVTTKVEEKKPAASPDKLTLSKGSVQGKPDETRIAQERAAKDEAQRSAELQRNIDDLKKAGAAIAPAPAAASSAPATPGVTVPLPAPATPVASTPAPPPPSPVKAPPPPPPPAPVEEPSFIDELLGNPLIGAGLAAVIALLGGALWYRKRQQKKAADAENSSLESRLQPESFFGASGAHQVDTNADAAGPRSSIVYPSSQLDPVDDVDPVAEAEVYMAYGRDRQAEEILQDALKTTPQRIAIHTKLLEIFAKRRDVRAFEAMAVVAYGLCSGAGTEWSQICRMGLEIDPENPLYQPGGAPGMQAPVAAAAAFSQTVQQPSMPEVESAGTVDVDLDLDLDFSLDVEEPAAVAASAPEPPLTPPPAPEPLPDIPLAPEPEPPAPPAAEKDPHLLDFDLGDAFTPPAPAAPEPEPPKPAGEPMLDLGLDLPDLQEPVPTPAAPTPAAATSNDAGMLEFDLGSLSLDLDAPASDAPASEIQAPDLAASGEDPLETKLALADEFLSIGDEDGARALIEEVLAEATGDLKTKAEQALAQLG